jgi:protein phosphatase
MQTDVGLVRQRNEDAAYLDPQLQLYVVADGLGGAQAGHVASAMSVDVIRQRLEAERAAFAAFTAAPGDAKRQQLKALLAAAVREAHAAVRARAACEPDKHGMGSTLEVAVIAGRDVFLAHVGDSRTYLVRNGLASQITRDHSMAQVLVMAGTLSPDDAARSPLAAIVVNAIGVAPEVTVDVVHLELRDGDRLLLCSDGLFGDLTRDELAQTLSRGAPPERLAQLVTLARARGGHDNITGIVVEVTVTGVPVEGRVRRQLAVGTAPPSPSQLPTPDPWDEDETTLPRAPTGPITPKPKPPEALAPNPLAEVPDDALAGFVEYSLYEDSRPCDAPADPA